MSDKNYPIASGQESISPSEKMVDMNVGEVLNGRVLLGTYQPDRVYRVTITGYVEIDFSTEITSSTQFKVDYNNGAVYFDSSQEGTNITISEFWAKGRIYLDATKVTDPTTGSDQSTINDSLQGQIDAISGAGANATIGVFPMEDVTNTNDYVGAFTGFVPFDRARVNLKVTNRNAGASTLNAEGSGAEAIVTKSGTALTGNELVGTNELQYDLPNTRWELINTDIPTYEEVSELASIIDIPTTVEDGFISDNGGSAFEMTGLTIQNLAIEGDFSAITKFSSTAGTLTVVNNKLVLESTGASNPLTIKYDFGYEFTVGFEYYCYVACSYTDDTVGISNIQSNIDGDSSGTNQLFGIVTGVDEGELVENAGRVTIPSDFTGNTVMKINLVGTEGELGRKFVIEPYIATLALVGDLANKTDAELLKICRNGFIDGMQSIENQVVNGCGKNHFNKEASTLFKRLTTDGSLITSSVTSTSDYIVVPSNGIVLHDGDVNTRYVNYYSGDDIFLGYEIWNDDIQLSNVPDGAVKYRFSFYNDNIDLVIATDSINTIAYEQFKSSNPLTLPVTVKSVDDITDLIYINNSQAWLTKKCEESAIATATVVNTTNFPLASATSKFVLLQDDGTCDSGEVDGTYTTTDAGDIVYELTIPTTEVIESIGALEVFKGGVITQSGDTPIIGEITLQAPTNNQAVSLGNTTVNNAIGKYITLKGL